MVVVWAVVAVLGLVSAGRLSGLLTTSLSVPGTSSAKADALLSRHFGENIDGTFTVVVAAKGPVRDGGSLLRAKVRAAASFLPDVSVSEAHVVGRTFYADVNTSEGLVAAADAVGELRQHLRAVGLTTAQVTGAPALEHDISPVLTSDLRRGVVVSVVVAALLLLLVLGWSWAVLVPFLVAGATSALALLIVFALAHEFLMALYVPSVIELIGLGLAIDYSLLIVHRFRRELGASEGASDEAVVRTMNTAGRTVLTSGLVVAGGLVTLFLVPVPFVRSLGVAGLLVPLVAMLGVVTLQPALLSLWGRRGVGAHGFAGVLTSRAALAGLWARLTRAVLARRRVALAGALVVLAALAASSWWLQLTPASLSALPSSMSSARALDALSARFGPGVATPIEIVIDTGRRGGAATPSEEAARLRLAKIILTDPEVAIVAIGDKAPYVGGEGRYEQIYVIGRDEFGAPATQALVGAIRAEDIARAGLPAGTTAEVGGAAAQGVDFLNGVYDVAPWIVAATLLISYVLLLRAFRSALVPLVSAILVLVSLAAAYGVMVAVFRFGVGSTILGTYHVGQIEGWVPIFLFALLFGLSTDYQVFIVARVREALLAGASHEDAIVEGLAHTGGVVSAAATIMVGALAGLVIGHVAGLQELGVGLAAGVFVDATIVRGVVLPSVMRLLGRSCWWVPAWMARVVRIPPSPLEARGDGGSDVAVPT